MNTYITGISYYLPAATLTNEDISREFPEWSIDKIAQKTGIFSRHIAAADEHVSDMAVSAFKKLVDEYGMDKREVDYIILCTQSPDYLLPTTACIVQDKCGISKAAGAIDINLGCSGYIYGLGLAKGLVGTGQAKNVVLITSEAYSKILHPKDKSSRTLFGDGATATLISSKPNHDFYTASIEGVKYGTDGSGYDKLIVRNSGSKSETTDSTDELDAEGNFVANDDYLFMNGREIFNFTAFQIPPLIDQVLEVNSLSIDKVSHFVFHQANAYMLDFIRKRCKIPEEKFYVSMDDVGNTVSSTIPIALKRLIGEQTPQAGDMVLLAGFGVGLSMGGLVLKTI